MEQSVTTLQDRVTLHLESIYADTPLDVPVRDIAHRLLKIIRLDDATEVEPTAYINQWNQQDMVLITYADSIKYPDQVPLQTLADFLDRYCKALFNSVHILPFFPYSSDDGFAVSNFKDVNPDHGSWQDIERIAEEYRLMADLVINHCSASNSWFENFKLGKSPGRNYFISISPDTDTSDVVRPRTSPLLKETFTEDGLQHVWCTFGHDQVDLNFRNPAVLEEIVNIIRVYLDKGVRIFRLDAVAFIWKQLGTNCLNLPETHEIIRLLRTLIEHAQPDAVIITETNIPNRENLSYFGNANEAHAIYNFSLPPLLLNTLVTGDCTSLKTWVMSMPPSQPGTTYLNFIASHDGIGLRPVEGLLSEEQVSDLIKCMESFGGLISWRAELGNNKPYEINIALYDALQGTINGPDDLGLQRFICAHAIMLSIEGIPAIYIHSLLGTGNHPERVAITGQNRSINRYQWQGEELNQALEDPGSKNFLVYQQFSQLMKIRRLQPAFHPNATQFTLHLGSVIFGLWRQSMDRRQSIFCLYNISAEPQPLNFSDLNLIDTENWQDLISGELIEDNRSSVILKPYQALWLTNSLL